MYTLDAYQEQTLEAGLDQYRDSVGEDKHLGPIHRGVQWKGMMEPDKDSAALHKEPAAHRDPDRVEPELQGR